MKFKRKQEHLPVNEMFAQSKYRGFSGSGQHGPVKIIFSKDAMPVVDPPTKLGMRAGELRRLAPKCEVLLRDALAKEFGPSGIEFQHSVAMFGYIADFYCPTRDAIIELDGPQHAERREYDRRRDEVFRINGIRTFRYPSKWAHRAMPFLLARIGRDLKIGAF